MGQVISSNELLRQPKIGGNYIKKKIDGFPVEIGQVIKNGNSLYNNFGCWIQLNPNYIDINENNCIIKRFEGNLRRFINNISEELFEDIISNKTIKEIEIGTKVSEGLVYMKIETNMFFNKDINIIDIEFERTLHCFNSLIIDYLNETQEFIIKTTGKINYNSLI